MTFKTYLKRGDRLGLNIMTWLQTDMATERKGKDKHRFGFKARLHPQSYKNWSPR